MNTLYETKVSFFPCLRPCPVCGTKLLTDGRGHFKCSDCLFKDQQKIRYLKRKARETKKGANLELSKTTT